MQKIYNAPITNDSDKLVDLCILGLAFKQVVRSKMEISCMQRRLIPFAPKCNTELSYLKQMTTTSTTGTL